MRHYRKVIAKIFSSRYPYARMYLLVSYKILVLRSIAYHKVKFPGRKGKIKKGFFTGFSLRFFSWPQILNLFEEIFIFQVYQFSHSNRSPLIIDCGSNIGVSILYFKKLFPDCRIVGFEPDQDAFQLLSQNITSNKLENVTLHNIALDKWAGKKLLYSVDDENRTLNMSLIYESEKIYSKPVVVKRLSSFIHGSVDLLKIDVEGSETGIIDDLIETKKINFVRQMIIEYHPHITGITTEVFIAKLISSGFEVMVRPNELHQCAREVMMVGKASLVVIAP